MGNVNKDVEKPALVYSNHRAYLPCTLDVASMTTPMQGKGMWIMWILGKNALSRLQLFSSFHNRDTAYLALSFVSFFIIQYKSKLRMAQAVRDQRCDIVKAPFVRCVCISQKHDVEVEVGAKLLKLFSAPRVLSGKRHMGNYF